MRRKTSSSQHSPLTSQLARPRTQFGNPAGPGRSDSPRIVAAHPFYRAGCLPVICFERPLAWTDGPLAPRVPARIRLARTEEEILFGAQNHRHFPHEEVSTFDHGAKTKTVPPGSP